MDDALDANSPIRQSRPRTGARTSGRIATRSSRGAGSRSTRRPEPSVRGAVELPSFSTSFEMPADSGSSDLLRSRATSQLPASATASELPTRWVGDRTESISRHTQSTPNENRNGYYDNTRPRELDNQRPSTNGKGKQPVQLRSTGAVSDTSGLSNASRVPRRNNPSPPVELPADTTYQHVSLPSPSTVKQETGAGKSSSSRPIVNATNGENSFRAPAQRAGLRPVQRLGAEALRGAFCRTVSPLSNAAEESPRLIPSKSPLQSFEAVFSASTASLNSDQENIPRHQEPEPLLRSFASISSLDY